MDSIVSPGGHASSTKTYEKDDQSLSETSSKIKQTISLLPKDRGLTSFEELCQYQGFWFASNLIEGVMLSQEKFHAKPADIFICSTMKSGTTWLKALCFAIYTRTQYDDSSNPLLTTNPHEYECMPLLERDIDRILSQNDGEDDGSGHPLISTHMPFSSLPKSILHEGCKIIYICRDPKDTFVSMWHFFNRIWKSRGIGLVPIKKALDLFSKGLLSFGPFWDHVLGYWKASLENPDKVLFLKYEDMKRDTGFYVKELASFMGCPFYKEEEMEGIVEKIVCLCSFGNLSNLEVNKIGKHQLFNASNVIEQNVFFRKGETGDWKNYLAEEDAASLDAITEEKFRGSGLILH